jgi:mRNA-degrading endonuclease RelE of RelBE toxin-antitoxin system
LTLLSLFDKFILGGALMFELELKNKAKKQLSKLDISLKAAYVAFFQGLKINPFLGKLSETSYHAHVKYHWVAVWEVDKLREMITITYIGSREDAPY